MNGDPAREVASLLKEHGARLTRTKRHLVYKFPDGKMFTKACTPSDFRAENNQLRDLKKLLGLYGERGIPGVRRVAKQKPGVERERRITPSVDGKLQEALQTSGLALLAAEDRIAALTLQLADSRRANHRKKFQLRVTQKHCIACWGCKARRWWKRLRERIKKGFPTLERAE